MKDQHFDIFYNAPVFAGLSKESIDKILATLKRRHFKAGSFIFHEGDEDKNCYLILSGSALILKKDAQNVSHELTTLKPGALLGEIAMIDELPRSASVLCSEDCEFLLITKEDIRRLIDKDKQFYHLMTNITSMICRTLRTTNETVAKALMEKLESYKIRVQMSQTLISLIALLSFLSFFNLIGNQLLTAEHISSSYLTVPLTLALSLFLLVLFKVSNMSVVDFGLRLDNIKQVFWGTLGYSAIFCSLTLLLKFYLIAFVSSYAHQPFFSLYHSYEGNTVTPIKAWLADMVIYSLVTIPFQELLARGGLQTSLQKILTGKHHILLAILISNLVFMTAHVFMSIWIALLVFIPGLFFGWLFQHYKSIFSPILAHMIIGVFALNIVGF